MGVRAVMNLTPGECGYRPLRALISDGSCDEDPTDRRQRKAVMQYFTTFVAETRFQRRDTKQVALRQKNEFCNT